MQRTTMTVNADNKFAPYTWEIEGLKKPQKVQSNVPTDIMAKDQRPMGVPIKYHFDPNAHVDVPQDWAKTGAPLEKYAQAMRKDSHPDH